MDTTCLAQHRHTVCAPADECEINLLKTLHLHHFQKCWCVRTNELEHLKDVLRSCDAHQPVLTLQQCSRKVTLLLLLTLLFLLLFFFFFPPWILSLSPDVPISFPDRPKWEGHLPRQAEGDACRRRSIGKVNRGGQGKLDDGRTSPVSQDRGSLSPQEECGPMKPLQTQTHHYHPRPHWDRALSACPGLHTGGPRAWDH